VSWSADRPSAAAVALEAAGLEKRYAGGPSVLRDVSFEVRDGEFLAIVGRSGCGKTTLLRMLCGLTAPSGGAVRVEGRGITSPPRVVTLIFQDYGRSLLPWLTVRGNVLFALRGRRDRTREAKRELADTALRAVELEGSAARYPWQLSGGMQQRVAIARAIAFRPRILLMDEPFSSVDALSRADLQDLMLRLQRELGLRTVVLVTHDIDEAVYMADRVLVLGAQPSRVVDDLAVPLHRPRDQVGTRSSPDFLTLRNRLRTTILEAQHE
jgi:NitT/TauT family transport system ATP-binding protein